MLYNYVVYFGSRSCYCKKRTTAYDMFVHYCNLGYESVALFNRAGKILAKCELGKTIFYWSVNYVSRKF